MTRHRFTSAFTRSGRRAWLLWLALLWPLAGMAALLHSYGHVQVVLTGQAQQLVLPVSGDGELNLHDLKGCDLCLAAAASLLGAAPVLLDAAPLVRLPQAHHASLAVPPQVRQAGPHFSARAPPHS